MLHVRAGTRTPWRCQTLCGWRTLRALRRTALSAYTCSEFFAAYMITEGAMLFSAALARHAAHAGRRCMSGNAHHVIPGDMSWQPQLQPFIKLSGRVGAHLLPHMRERPQRSLATAAGGGRRQRAPRGGTLRGRGASRACTTLPRRALPGPALPTGRSAGKRERAPCAKTALHAACGLRKTPSSI